MTAYLITDIIWNTDDEEYEDLPESVIAKVPKTWNSDTQESILESLADNFAWEARSFTHEVIDPTDEQYYGLPEIEIIL